MCFGLPYVTADVVELFLLRSSAEANASADKAAVKMVAALIAARMSVHRTSKVRNEMKGESEEGCGLLSANEVGRIKRTPPANFVEHS